MKKNIPIIRKREGNKKSIPIIREWESEAFILGNGREREFPLTPVVFPCTENCENVKFQNPKREIQKMRCFQFEALSFAL